jgi:hypothetical protein
MLVALLQLAQATAAAPPVDLHADPCPSHGADIVICGSRTGDSPYRLPRLPERYDKKPLRAQTTIGGAQAAARITSPIRQDGLQDHRIMITFALPF